VGYFEKGKNNEKMYKESRLQTLRVTPAMQANVTHRLWSWEDLLLSAQMKKAA
jgi:hypothetical protein